MQSMVEPNRTPKSQLTGGEARWEAELLLELLPDPELGYEGTGTGEAARGMWVSAHYCLEPWLPLTSTSTPVPTTVASSQYQVMPPCTGTTSAVKPMAAEPPRYTWPSRGRMRHSTFLKYLPR